MKAPIRFTRRLWIPGMCYGDETAEQAARRDELCREEAAAIDAAERAAELARDRPMPHLEAWAQRHGLWQP